MKTNKQPAALKKPLNLYTQSEVDHRIKQLTTLRTALTTFNQTNPFPINSLALLINGTRTDIVQIKDLCVTGKGYCGWCYSYVVEVSDEGYITTSRGMYRTYKGLEVFPEGFNLAHELRMNRLTSLTLK
jgi:hypothetical protein